MNEENQKLTLGAVQKEDLKFQPEPPQDELTAYFRDTDLGTILDDMNLTQHCVSCKDADTTQKKCKDS